MRLRFLGTRGEIEARTRRHRRHSSLLVGFRRREVMIDCGLDWRDALRRLRPAAIVLTHAHPDHAAGLRGGSPCPVYATAETWSAIGRYPISERGSIEPRQPLSVLGIEFEAFPVEHSLRAPAVGYRVTAGRRAIFYGPDVVSIVDDQEALSGVDLYVGDGAAVRRSIVRRRDGRAIGHASIRAQLQWCASARVRRAVFTHCGSEMGNPLSGLIGDDEDSASRPVLAVVQLSAPLVRRGWYRFPTAVCGQEVLGPLATIRSLCSTPDLRARSCRRGARPAVAARRVSSLLAAICR